MRRTASKIAAACLVAGLVVWVVVKEWTADRAVRDGRGEGRAPKSPLVTYVHRPIRIMGTQTMLKVVVPRGETQRANAAARQAEAALRNVEAKMSTWLDGTEVWQLNAAPADKVVKLSAATLDLLKLSRKLAAQTDGAFDVTCRPIIQLWKQAGGRKRLPTPAELTAARGRSGWDKIELLEAGARKNTDGAGVDLGGVAKGCGIDRAVEAMIAAGAAGGIVDVGGDVRCFGRRAGGGDWTVGVRDPFRTGRMFAYVAVAHGAVCTSGNYFRFVEIGGKRHSHIIDPRTGRSARAAPSVTVFAGEAVLADAWATALSVLGPEGLERLPQAGGLEAMIVTGEPDDYAVHMTAGFRKRLAGRPAWTPVVVRRPTSRAATAPAGAKEN